jgi:hypothetical protein
MSGEGAKARSRCRERNPKEQKPTRGSGDVEANRLGDELRIATWINALKARSPDLEPARRLASRRRCPTTGGHGPTTSRPGLVAGTSP